MRRQSIEFRFSLRREREELPRGLQAAGGSRRANEGVTCGVFGEEGSEGLTWFDFVA